jgi:superfamily I DNA/RNA helicase
MGLSREQEAIVGLPLQPIAVTACAGSGKTRTAVCRLARMRELHEHERSLVALLCFSNIAVETFRHEYAATMKSRPSTRLQRAVEIDTMDGFITTNMLRPHGYRAMKSMRTPFLVEGREPFLKSFTVFDGARSHSTAGLNISLQGGSFVYTIGRQAQVIDRRRAEDAVTRLGAVGAYTHASARYWVLRTLKEQPAILAALARRYPHVLIDEAQDIGPEHQAILELLIRQGTQVSLIGDLNQAIYEFAKADGTFLAGYGNRSGVTRQRLSVNYRSVPSIVAVANQLTNRDDTANRPAQHGRHGAFYMPYDPKVLSFIKN